MSFLLDKKLDHERRCEADIRAERYSAARFHAAKAAEFAFALGRQTDGTIAARYVEDAEGWLEIAEKLKQPPRNAASRGKSAGKLPTGDEPEGSPDDWLVTEKPKITFDMIAGMADAKDAIREMIVYPMQQPEKAVALGLKPGGGVLLYGPPGTGKTSLAKAAANQLDAAFFYASGAQIRSKWHGESEQRLRSLIEAAKAQPCAILFLDDVDGLLPKRGGHSVVDNRIVTQFLADVGGFDDSENVLMILGATNKPWEIDEAVFRTGRFDEKIYVGLPDAPARAGILKIHLDNVPAETGFDLTQWTDRLDGYTGSDIVGIVNAAKRAGLSRSVRENTDPVVRIADFENAFKNIPASVTTAMLKKYEEFRDARFV